MKKLIVALAVLVVLVIGAVFAARHFALGYLTPDFVVKTIEARWNCRAEIDSIDIKVGTNTTIELKQVALAPRDDFANNATPLADRPKLDNAAIRIALVSLEARPTELLKKHLRVEHLIIDQAQIATELGEDGGASVDVLFHPAPLVAAEPVADESATVIAADSEIPAADEEKAFVAGDMMISTAAGLVELKNSSMAITLRKSETVARLDDLHIAFKDIDLDPTQLVSHNSASFDFGGTLSMDGDGEDGQPVRFVELKVSGSGKVAPFDSETGLIEPAWSSTLVLHQGSRVETFPLVEKLQKKLEDIDTGGVDLSDINLRGELTADASTRLAHRHGRFTLEQPLALSLPDTSFAFQAGSWADTATNQHEIKGVVTASDALTKKIVAQVDKYLEKKLGGLVSGDLRKQVLGMALKDGRISIEFISSGDLGKPKVDVVTPFGTLGDLKQTFDGLKDALKGLFK